jgi:hypothetical protein
MASPARSCHRWTLRLRPPGDRYLRQVRQGAGYVSRRYAGDAQAPHGGALDAHRQGRQYDQVIHLPSGSAPARNHPTANATRTTRWSVLDPARRSRLPHRCRRRTQPERRPPAAPPVLSLDQGPARAVPCSRSCSLRRSERAQIAHRIHASGSKRRASPRLHSAP